MASGDLLLGTPQMCADRPCTCVCARAATGRSSSGTAPGRGVGGCSGALGPGSLDCMDCVCVCRLLDCVYCVCMDCVGLCVWIVLDCVDGVCELYWIV